MRPNTPVRSEGGVLYLTPSLPPKELDMVEMTCWEFQTGDILPFLGLSSISDEIAWTEHSPKPVTLQLLFKSDNVSYTGVIIK